MHSDAERNACAQDFFRRDAFERDVQRPPTLEYARYSPGKRGGRRPRQRHLQLQQSAGSGRTNNPSRVKHDEPRHHTAESFRAARAEKYRRPTVAELAKTLGIALPVDSAHARERVIYANQPRIAKQCVREAGPRARACRKLAHAQFPQRKECRPAERITHVRFPVPAGLLESRRGLFQ